ncbi:MAG: hypothetical protein HC875_37095, partial [Anaerolineales bacterium]|nr:hypothetical protein [Anaerolineales bacterium]
MTNPTSVPPTKTGLSWPVIVLALLLVAALAALAYTWTQAQQATQQAAQQIGLAQATATAASPGPGRTVPGHRRRPSTGGGRSTGRRSIHRRRGS